MGGKMSRRIAKDNDLNGTMEKMNSDNNNFEEKDIEEESTFNTFIKELPIEILFDILLYADQVRLVIPSAFIGSTLLRSGITNESKVAYNDNQEGGGGKNNNNNSNNMNNFEIGLKIRSITNLVMIPFSYDLVKKYSNKLMKDNYNVESRNRNVSLSLSEAIYCINIACVCKIWNQSLEDVKYINYNGDLTSPKGSMWFTSQFLSKQHDEQSLIASDENVSLLNYTNIRLLDFRLSNASIKNRHLILLNEKFSTESNLITTLNLSGCSLISNDGLSPLLKKSMHLKKLVLSECVRLTSSILMSIENHDMVESLDISNCTAMDDDALSIISNRLTNLKSLNLSGLKRACVHGHLLNVGKTCCKLEQLILRDLGALMSDNTMSIFVENCKSLKLIDVSFAKLSDNALYSLSKLRYLQVLIAESCQLLTTDGIVNSIGHLNFKHLNLRGCKQVDLSIVQRNIPNSWMPVRREGRRRNRRRRREYYL